MTVITIFGQVYILNNDAVTQYAAANILSDSIFFPAAGSASFDITENNERWNAWV